MCIKSGVSMIESLKISEEATEHPRLKTAIRQLLFYIESGRGLCQAMQAIPFFSPQDVYEIELGEYTGTLDGSLQNIIDKNEHEIGQRNFKLTHLLPKLIVIFFILIVAYNMVKDAIRVLF